ncbi:MAG: hypothetical protein F6K35_22335, partial [Okeania sp. SIO2H7]|nr:hypothetical protein [Okeania sp. SIO2H7]
MALNLKQFMHEENLPPESVLRLNLIAGGAIFASLLLWSLPPFLLSGEKTLHKWLQGLSLCGAIFCSSTALIIGYKLKKIEPILNAEQMQEREDYQHWLASSRYYSEAVREGIITAALQGEIEPVKTPLAPAKEPISPPPPEPVMPTYSVSESKMPLTPEIITSPEPQKSVSERLNFPDRDDLRTKKLWSKIENSTCEWLLQLLLTKPLLVWGEQCSGKTKFAGFLAMLRILFFKHQVSVADPHSHQNEWPHLFEVYGREYNYGQINSRLTAYYQRLKGGSLPHTSIWDEVTNYAENCEEKLAGRFLKSILSDVRKPPEFPILLSHSNTLSSLGGGKGGIKKMQVRGLVEVNLRAKRDRLGNLEPALKGTIKGLKVDDRGEAVVRPIELE